VAFRASVRPFSDFFADGDAADRAGVLCATAPAEHDLALPGFPSLLVTYSVAGDFFFSVTRRLPFLRQRRLRAEKMADRVAIAIVVFEIVTVLVLRHITRWTFSLD